MPAQPAGGELPLTTRTGTPAWVGPAAPAWVGPAAPGRIDSAAAGRMDTAALARVDTAAATAAVPSMLASSTSTTEKAPG